MKQNFIVRNEDIKQIVVNSIRNIPFEPCHEVIIREVKSLRNLIQNKKMWALLVDISDQIVWHGQKLSKENWKDIFIASLKQQKVVPGLDNNFVVLGTHTSKMTVAEMSEMIELSTAFGVQNNVKWRMPGYEGE